MQTSKSTFINILFSLFSSTLILGCNLPSPQDKGQKQNEAATFTVQMMTERAKVLDAGVQGDFALPSSKVFNLQACLKDIAYDKVIAGHDFKIEELGKKATTDKQGCLTWTETIHFNFLAESQYIRFERTIKGLGLHRGSQTVTYAINPWSHGENLPPVLNPEDGSAIPRLIHDNQEGELALKGLSKDMAPTERTLWVEDARLFISEQKMTQNGMNLHVEVRPNPSIQMAKMNGEIFLRPLTSGTFKARLKLIHSYRQENKDIRRQLAQTEFQNVKMENATLAIAGTMNLTALPTRGQIILGLELLPVQGPVGLAGFDGVYLIGDYDQIKGSAFLKLNSAVSQTKNFKLENYIDKELPAFTESNFAESENYQKPKIELSQMEFRFLRVGKETTETREIFYNVRACVRNGLDQKSIRAQTFKITKFRQTESESPSTVEIKTDNNACINWDESITFKYFDCQHYLKGFVTIENANLGMKENLQMLVNPWESQGLIARDLRYVSPSEKLSYSCKQEEKPRTQLILDGFSYNTVSYDYSIDAMLNLTVTKKIQVRMDPRLLIYSSLAHGRSEHEKLRDGIYLLKMAVVQNRDYSNSNTYVTSATKLVQVLAGQINTEISFRTQDLKALGNRNSMLVEIHPVDESKVVVQNGLLEMRDKSASLDSAINQNTSLETPTFIGPVTLNIDEASRPLRMVDATAVSAFFIDGKARSMDSQKSILKTIIEEGLKEQQIKEKRILARSEKGTFAKENNLEVVSLKNADADLPLVYSLLGSTNLPPRLMISKAELQAIVQTGSMPPAVAQKFCAFWNDDFFKKLYKDKGGVTHKRSRELSFDCVTTVQKDVKSFFQIEKHLLIKEVGASKLKTGLNSGLNVGTGFSLSTSYSTSKTRTTSLSAKFGLSKKFLDIFSVGLDAGYSMSWSKSDSNSASNSISVNTSTTMTVQQNIMKVVVNKYEQCAIVKLNPVLFMKEDKLLFARRNYLNVINHRLNDEEKVVAMTRGLMICEGEVRNTPIELTENYYLVAQETSSSQMQDNGDARNRNFFIALRSNNDYQRFVLAIKGETKMPNSAQKEENPHLDATQQMQSLFQMPGPSYPGMYLVN